MARLLTTNPQIDAFIAKVIGDAGHHAPGVVNIIMPLSQAVRARINLAVDTVKVYERNGNIARTCWVTLGHRRWCFSYNHQQGTIDLRQKSTQGALHFQFDNSTTQAALLAQVALL